MTTQVIRTMAKYNNICKCIHLPVQSGSSRILKLMNRGYNREEYIKLIDNIRSIIPDCAISMDIITGFCTETERDHKSTLSLMDYVKYEYGYMFKYSERPNTPASKIKDDISENIKQVKDSEVPDKPSGRLRGVLSPHIDYARGFLTYAKLWAVAAEDLSKIERVIILGTDHILSLIHI